MTERRDRRVGLLVLGLALLGLALAWEVLWLARGWQGDGVSFSINRVGLHVRLTAGQFMVFAFGSGLVASASVFVSWFAVRRALGARGAAWRHALAVVVVLLASWPLYNAIAWAAGGVLRAATYSGEWSRRQFLRELALVASTRLFWLSGLLALAGCLVTSPSRLLAGWSRVVARVSRVRGSVVAVGAVVTVFVLAALFLLAVFDGVPHYPDATAYELMARMFTAGQTTLPVVGLREFHDPQMLPYMGRTYVFSGDRWFCYGSPGAAVLFAAGHLVGLPWLMPPLLGAVVVALTGLVARELYGGSAALLAMALAAVSPWLIFMSGEYLAHVPCAAACLAFVVLAERAMSGSLASGAGAGLMLGLCACIRPQVAVPFAVPVAIVWLVCLVRRPREALAPAVLAVVLAALAVAGYLAYNVSTTGRAFAFGYWFRGDPVPGLASAPASSWRWTPMLGLSNLQHTVYGVGVAMHRWPVHALGLLVGALVVLGPRVRPGRGRLALVLFSSAALIGVIHAFHTRVLIGLGGPRYGFEAVPIIFIFGAGMLTRAAGLLTERGIPRERVLGALAAPLLVCLAYGTLATVRLQLPGLHKYLGVDGSVFHAVAARVDGPALVFVTVEASDESTNRFYAAIGRNAPDLDGPVVYARDLGERNAVLAEARPGRYAYRCDLATGALEPLAIDGALPPVSGSSPSETPAP